jgi:hypothetical protein
VAGRLIWANVSFSATGGIEMTGGQVVVDQSDVWNPAVQVTRGGVIGLELAMLGDALFSVIQVLFWLTTESDAGADDDDDEGDEDSSLLEKAKQAIASFRTNPLPLVFGLSMCADIFSTWYYLNIAYVSKSDGIFALVIRYVATLLFTFLFFSFVCNGRLLHEATVATPFSGDSGQTATPAGPGQASPVSPTATSAGSVCRTHRWLG